MYNFLLTEGDVRRILTALVRRRIATGKAHCLQLHIEPGNGNIRVAHVTVEVLSREMLAEMQDKGQLDITGLEKEENDGNNAG